MSVTDEIKARLDIVNFLSQYIQLKKAGRNYVAPCPFHAEKTPSFVVFPDSQNWRCFGACGEGGDIFNFVMKQEGLDFAAALKVLADKAGVTLQERSPEQTKGDEHLDKLRGLLDETTNFFHEKLLNFPGAKYARDYVKKRGLNDQTLEEFRIGYAPDEWRQALDHLKLLGYQEEDILEAGVALRNEEKGRVYDRFRNRLIIPICDVRGQVIGFGARALKADDNPKYLNSPQTTLFDKSATLFGLHLARRAIRENETAVIVEGYMDAIQAHQAGFRNVVAEMGTALTELQLKQLSKYAKRLILALDPDAAGIKATMHGLDVARKTLGDSTVIFDPRGAMRQASRLDAELLVITVPDGKDPDDLIREDPAAWQALVGNAQSVVDYLIEAGTAHITPHSTFTEREQAARDLLPLMVATENDLQQLYNIQRLALRLNLDARTLTTWAQRGTKSAKQPRLTGAQPVVPPPAQSPTQQPVPATVQAGGALERYCLSILMRTPQLWSLVNRKLREIAGYKATVQTALGPLSADDFSNSDFRAIIRLLEQALDQDDLEPIEYLEKHLPYELRIEVERLLSDPAAAFKHHLLPQLLDREKEQIAQTIIRTPDEFLQQVLNLRKQRLKRDNQTLYYLIQDTELSSDLNYRLQYEANQRAIRLIDETIRQMVELQRDLN